ncbi:MAG: DUF924 domain-containing protein [Sterolibacteriaceae bacterium MAG5]|nr:DUF924 domain-containing protein [Candidatus Nitricoxidireducens bremensis]
MAAALSPAAAAVLDFWFLPAGHAGHDVFRPEWFRKDPAFDAAIRERFGPLVDEALAGGLGDWDATADGALARILLLDQFTRNLFRGDALAFAGDAAALALAESLVASGRDKNLPPIRRWFVFLPFEHSESLLNQERAVALFAGLRREAQHPAFESAYDYAVRHRDVIERFGRFPHRNAVLGRPSTHEEEAYLKLPGSGF